VWGKTRLAPWFPDVEGCGAIEGGPFQPGEEGIPPLIEVAKTTQNAEVRKQAMSSLAQSRDPRVLAFLEDVLKR
jgi:hypothetical protein